MFKPAKKWIPWDNWIECSADGLCVVILALILPPLFHGNRPSPGFFYFFAHGFAVVGLYALFLGGLVVLRGLHSRHALADHLLFLMNHGRYFLAAIFCVAIYGLFLA